jgi:superfamily II DNA or RNA helicase
MSIALRPYQSKIIAEVRDCWNSGARNVLAVAPTGAGKTVLFGEILRTHDGASCAIAHRRELVGQMSVTLARLEVRHNIIAPTPTVREIVTRHMQEVGRSYYNALAPCAVAGVHTIGNRDLGPWAQKVSLWITDESHHLQAKNLWGKALALFPNARGLGVTATPERADGRGLSRASDGLMDAMVLGPSMRELINDGYLTDYRIFAPQSDLDRASLPVSESTGDFSAPALREAARKSHITGDLVDSYLKIAPGKLGVSFCVSVELATETAAKYRAAGVAAEVVSADTPELVRAAILRRFAAREIMQLVNVDLFGEGFDLPAIEVVSMGRPTESYGLYAQQFGRALRPMPGKPHAIIIDHVGNVMRHGLPDAPRAWSLERRERRSRGQAEDAILVKTCPACTAVYERFYRECPFCGHVPVPISRAAPQHVDGDLLELDAAVLERLRGTAAGVLIAEPAIPYGASEIVANSIRKRHREMVAAQMDLRQTIALWAGWQRALGRSDSESYRRFYLQFGTDVTTAQTLKRAEAVDLAERVAATMKSEGIEA